MGGGLNALTSLYRAKGCTINHLKSKLQSHSGTSFQYVMRIHNVLRQRPYNQNSIHRETANLIRLKCTCNNSLQTASLLNAALRCFNNPNTQSWDRAEHKPVSLFCFLRCLSPQHQYMPHYGCNKPQLVIILL